jgi:hypothetical protein
MSAPAPPNAEPTRRHGTRQPNRWGGGLGKVTRVQNQVEARVTRAWVGLGLASEANPFLAELVTAHPILFVSTKLGLVGLGSLLLWRLRHRPLAVIAMFVAFLVYYGILLMHVDYLGYVIGILLSS